MLLFFQNKGRIKNYLLNKFYISQVIIFTLLQFDVYLSKNVLFLELMGLYGVPQSFVIIVLNSTNNSLPLSTVIELGRDYCTMLRQEQFSTIAVLVYCCGGLFSVVFISVQLYSKHCEQMIIDFCQLSHYCNILCTKTTIN